MPETAAVNDLYEVRIIGNMEGSKTYNVLHFKCVGASADVNAGLIIKLIACLIDNLVPVLSSAWTFETVNWKKVSPVLGIENVTIPQGVLTGGGAATCLPSYCSAVVSKRTLTGGRSHRGRMYIAGIPEDQTNGSKFNVALPFWLALVQTLACILSVFNFPDPAGATDAFQLVVYSRKIGGSSYPLGLTGVTNVSQLIPDQVIGTTRSRKLGRGV